MGKTEEMCSGTHFLKGVKDKADTAKMEVGRERDRQINRKRKKETGRQRKT